MSPQRPPGTGPPINLTGPGPFGTVHIDIAAPVASSSTQNQSDLAGVLRRNQACLQCRKRKLKCDAVRPHCATCVRSYRHSLRTAPKSNPVLCCDYDDGTGTHEDEGPAAHHSVSPSAGAEDDDNGGAKKKRKASGEGKRKKKGEEFEEERNRLTRQIEELQAQLSRKEQQPSQQQWVDGGISTADKTWSSTARPFQDTTIAPSPTAFLEMLSSAASSKEAASAGQPQQQGKSALSSSSLYNTNENVMNPGPMFGIGGQEEMHDSNAQPFRSMFAYNAPQQEASINAIDVDTSPDSATHHLSRQTSAQDDRASGSIVFSSGNSSSAPNTNILSPNGIFNFSPGPIEAATENNMWAPPLSINGTMEPTTRTDGPWKGVETIDTVLGNMSAAMGRDGAMDMGADFNLDGLQAGLDASVQEQLLMDLFWPGWPKNLPEPNVVTDLIEAFFEHVPNLSRLLHRPRFLARMALPPTHSNFPHPALIHAVCAAAAAWCPSEIYEKSKKAQQWSFESETYAGIGMHSVDGEKPKMSMSFGLCQASFAKEAVTEGLNTGNRLFDVLRAMIILCRVFFDDTRMLECWAYSGLVARMILPLGLNVRSAELALKSVMLPPPADALEREERRAAIWMAFYHDSIASAASGWGTSIALDELSVPLPVSAKDFDLGEPFIAPNPQDFESPDLWVKHPVADSFVMAVKASLLINRVNRFARKWKNRHLRDNDDFEGMSRPEFSELSNAIACFQMSFPPGMRNICKLNARGKFDQDLIAAHMLPYAAIICLYEPFADVADPSDQAARRVLSAAQGICALVRQLAGTVSRDGTNFASDMHASVSVCLVTSARTLLVFLRQALNVGDEVTASIYKMEAETMRIALSQFGLRFKIGHHHSQLIESFMDRCLNPTYEKLSAHYPEHPRTGASMELTKESNFGLCVANALNVKRGYWRLPKLSSSFNSNSTSTSTGFSPLQSTPESIVSNGSGGSGSGSGFSQTSGYGSGSTNNTSTSIHNQGNGNGNGLTTEEELRFKSTLDIPEGHTTLLFGQTEEADKFYADRDHRTLPASSISNVNINTNAPNSNSNLVGEEVNRPGYGIDSNGSNIDKLSCTPWPKNHSTQFPIPNSNSRF